MARDVLPARTCVHVYLCPWAVKIITGGGAFRGLGQQVDCRASTVAHRRAGLRVKR